MAFVEKGLEANLTFSLVAFVDASSFRDPTPFGLSLLKPFDKLRANGSKSAARIYKNLNRVVRCSLRDLTT